MFGHFMKFNQSQVFEFMVDYKRETRKRRRWRYERRQRRRKDVQRWGILRYHLGLIIPKNGFCFISVDGETYDWKEGEGVLFDETYKHFVINDTNYYRVILFLDVKRVLNFPLNIVNDIILYLMGISPYN